MLIGSGAATFPGTVTGLRWCISGINTGAVAEKIGFSFQKTRGGATSVRPVRTTAAGAGAQTTTEEVDTIVEGIIPINGAQAVDCEQGSTSSMRKLNKGDAIWLTISACDAATSVYVMVQFFYKT